jgi:hypothetical protein
LRSSSWLNETALCRTAVNSFTGIAINPKLVVPLQVHLARGVRRYLLGRSAHPQPACAPFARRRGTGSIADESTL